MCLTQRAISSFEDLVKTTFREKQPALCENIYPSII